ncbi:ATP-binding protein [Sphaerisporangium perillae]|uniref:ATP-binding protein n=1 Tax=Sphaerisporangium perillae TaxID=2935860 RepID=UPI00200BB657|nr:AAA family ATPase [Sphaerisporangium perillae]
MASSPAHVTLHDIVKARLAESGLPAEAQEAVLAALGDPPPEAAGSLAGIYLRAITVAGFRGIGRPVRLELPHGNGLVVVTGRNGSGKSSFAEAVEMALTGQNSRWNARSQVWTSSFRNLHSQVNPEIEVDLLVSGESEPTIVRREWTGAKVEDSAAFVRRPGQELAPLSSLNLVNALTAYRPFLPYAELGSALDKPSDLYDKVSAILGLGPLAEACAALRNERNVLDKKVTASRQDLLPLLGVLADFDDPRARAVHTELSEKDPDLARVETLAAGDEAHGALRALRRVAELVGPDPEAVRAAAERVRSASRALAEVRRGSAEDARERAELLDMALTHHRRHQDDRACPVCEAPDRLDEAWAVRAQEEVTRLRREAATAEAARDESRSAWAAAHRLIGDPPAGLPESLAASWQEWQACREGSDVERFAEVGLRLAEEYRLNKEEAAKRLADHDDRWSEPAGAVVAWCRQAREAAAAKVRLPLIKAADAWLHDVHDDLRAARMSAQGQDARMYWAIMRRQSNVSLGEVRLAGNRTQRKVELDVTVDDVSGAALGVMSQGELHALALSLFLPRALANESPFRFLVIDDPVQSMDPSKVDGLAQVLEAVAERRQVVVFTHDTRLAEAVRRLRIPATILELLRKERSEVEVQVSDDPVERALKEARSVLADIRLPPGVAPAVLPGMCRVALESAFVEVARRRLLTADTDHDTVERRISEARKSSDIAALALGVESGEVVGRLNRDFGGWAGKVFRACNRGAHEEGDFQADLRGNGDDPIGYVTKLARRLREVG